MLVDLRDEVKRWQGSSTDDDVSTLVVCRCVLKMECCMTYVASRVVDKYFSAYFETIQMIRLKISIFFINRNGAYESGLYIAFNYLLDMSNCEQEIDVTQVIKQIRVTRPQFIANKVRIVFVLLQRSLKGMHICGYLSIILFVKKCGISGAGPGFTLHLMLRFQEQFRLLHTMMLEMVHTSDAYSNDVVHRRVPQPQTDDNATYSNI